jgi:hypothetical protein
MESKMNHSECINCYPPEDNSEPTVTLVLTESEYDNLLGFILAEGIIAAEGRNIPTLTAINELLGQIVSSVQP